jgi:hypothetical protein
MDRTIIAEVRFCKYEAYIFDRKFFDQWVFGDVFVIVPTGKFVPKGVKKNKKSQNKNSHKHPGRSARPGGGYLVI